MLSMNERPPFLLEERKICSNPLTSFTNATSALYNTLSSAALLIMTSAFLLVKSRPAFIFIQPVVAVFPVPLSLTSAASASVTSTPFKSIDFHVVLSLAPAVASIVRICALLCSHSLFALSELAAPSNEKYDVLALYGASILSSSSTVASSLTPNAGL